MKNPDWGKKRKEISSILESGYPFVLNERNRNIADGTLWIECGQQLWTTVNRKILLQSCRINNNKNKNAKQKDRFTCLILRNDDPFIGIKTQPHLTFLSAFPYITIDRSQIRTIWVRMGLPHKVGREQCEATLNSYNFFPFNPSSAHDAEFISAISFNPCGLPRFDPNCLVKSDGSCSNSFMQIQIKCDATLRGPYLYCVKLLRKSIADYIVLELHASFSAFCCFC